LGFEVFLIAMPLYFGGTAVPVQDTARYSNYVTSINTAILIRTSLADTLIMIGFVVVLAGFRHLTRQARQEYEWLATLVFGLALLLVALELVADGLETGAAPAMVVHFAFDFISIAFLVRRMPLSRSSAAST
jgi:hypothetical protein